MKKSNIIWIVVGLFVVILCFGGCSSYNKMVTQEEAVNESWANVQASYQRRLDLIPNLVETVKGYAKHESTTLEGVTAQRTGNLAPAVQQAGDSLMAAKDAVASFSGPDAQGTTPGQYARLDRAYSLYINAVREAYPDLKANENFMDLQKQLEGTENRINTERVRYNKAVQTYNVYIRRFPNNLFAGIFGFDTKQMFQADQQAQQAVKVSFD